MKKEFIILFLIILLANIILYSSIILNDNEIQTNDEKDIILNNVADYVFENNAQDYEVSQPVLNVVELAEQIEEQRLAEEKAEQEAYNSYGTTVHSLYNGYIYYLADNTVWEQVGLGLGTFISNSEIFIYEYNNQYYMKVKNVNDSVRVQRIK